MISRSRLFDILPGALTWGTILIPFFVSIFWPEGVMVFLVMYTALWLFRSLEFSWLLIRMYGMSRWYLEIDWEYNLKYFQHTALLQEDLKRETQPRKKRFLQYLWKRIQEEQKNGTYTSPEEIYHIVIMATYQEDLEVLRTSMERVARSSFDTKKIFFILAGEERDKERAISNAKILEQEYKNMFAGFYFSLHPKDIVGEVKGKGSNISYAAKKIIPSLLEQYQLHPANILVTTLDADNCVHPAYFSNLTLFYLITEKREQKSYQPLPLFYNNIWEVPMFNRVLAFGSSFWHMIESGRPDRLRNFSSHAQSLSGLLKTDYWSTQTIVEDGHQYWRSFFAFQGDYSVIPLFIPIYQDAVQNDTFTKTMIGQYKQLRRWAWGCSDIPYVIQQMQRYKHVIPFWTRTVQLYRLAEGHFMWATAPVIITLTIPVPRMINASFANTAMSYNMGIILSNFFSIAMVGVFVTIWISLLMAPPKPKQKNIWKTIWLHISSILQWFLLPITTLIFGSIPAIESQTRLMLGKSLDFQVTEKKRTYPTPLPHEKNI